MIEVSDMEERMRRKLHSDKAFTMAETLLAVLILLLASTIVATGVPVAKNAYEKVVLASNAEVLLSTAISTLRNELGTAMDVKVSDTEIAYYSSQRGATSKIDLDAVQAGSSERTIVLYRYFGNLVQDSGAERIAMSSSATAKRDLYTTYQSVAYDEDNGIITFTGLSVNRISGTAGLATRDTLSIRVIAA